MKPKLNKDDFHAQFHGHEGHLQDGNHETTEWWEHYQHQPGVKKYAMGGYAALDFSKKNKAKGRLIDAAMERLK